MHEARGGGRRGGEGKPQEKVSGWKEVRRGAKEKQRVRGRGSYLYHPRGTRDAKKERGERYSDDYRDRIFAAKAVASLLMQNSSATLA